MLLRGPRKYQYEIPRHSCSVSIQPVNILKAIISVFYIWQRSISVLNHGWRITMLHSAAICKSEPDVLLRVPIVIVE